MGIIDWIPLADIPETLKDGREVMLWNGIPHIGLYGHYDEDRWSNRAGALINPAFVAEINAPCPPSPTS